LDKGDKGGFIVKIISPNPSFTKRGTTSECGDSEFDKKRK
jgi:hypothetical protein